MAVKVQFETATLADAVNRAARVSPTKGAAYDRSSGVIIAANADGAVIRSTNLEVTYRQEIDVLSADGDLSVRVPASTASGFLSGLPMGEGSVVTLVDNGDDDWVRLSCGKTKARLADIPLDNFPNLPPFDIGDLGVAENFSSRLEQVAWACSPDVAPLTGVHIDGEHLIATDKFKVAIVPCVVPLDAPITVPLGTIAPLLRNTSEVRIGSDGSRLMMMTDEFTQATSVIYGSDFPNIIAVIGAAVKGQSFTCTLPIGALEKALDRVLVLVSSDRYPVIKMTFKPDGIGIDLDAQTTGQVRDEIEVPVEMEEDELVIWMNPAFVREAMGHATGELKIKGGPTGMNPVEFSDDTGYQCFVMPRAEMTGATAE